MVRNIKMEPTFYDEHQYSTNQPRGGDVSQLKRSLTLDLNGSSRMGVANGPAAKRTKLSSAPMLSSPDLNMLKLGSPELEKLIIAQQNGVVTTTPTPTQILFPRDVTEEQEIYARGFVEALNELHGGSDSSQGASGCHSVDTITYTQLEPSNQQNYGQNPAAFSLPNNHVQVKDEPQTVPSLGNSPPLSPINMECQEKIKLERKRQRNRIAASKCRRRKLERISRLEDKVKLLKGENTELGTVLHRLKEQVCQLKEQVMDHVHNGCQIILSQQF